MLKKFQISTQKRYQLVDITDKVIEVVKESQVKEGLLLIFVPHSTAGIVLTENEEGLEKDWLKLFKKITEGLDFSHNRIDDNADSHLLSGFIGQGKSLIIEKGEIILGTWQQIFLAEFDGPKERQIVLKFPSS